MFGGLGGLGGGGGGDWNQTLMGLAIMSDSMTPRTASNPQDMAKTLAPLMAMNNQAGEERAVAQALIAAGIPPAQAFQMAKSPAAVGIMMKLREQQRQDSNLDKANQGLQRLLDGDSGGRPSAPSGPAVPSIGGQKRSDINVPEAETPFHSLVMNAEGTAKGRGFNETLAYGKFTGGPVELTGMKVSDVLSLQQQMLRHPENSYNSSAAGGYQVVGKTLRGLVAAGVVSPDDTYDAKTQNKIASHLAIQRGPNVAGLRNEWEGLRNVSDEKILSAWQQSFGRGAPTRVASNDSGFVPTSTPQAPAAAASVPTDSIGAQYDRQIAEAEGSGNVRQAAELREMRDFSAKQRGAQQAPAPAAAPQDWRTAQATPEQFDEQLARARGEAPAPPQAQQAPQVATQAPTAPPAPPLPIQRPPAPQQPAPPPGAAQGQPQGMPSIDPNSSDGGARVFAASGMGRGGPFLTPPKPMALAGAPASPAPVTAPVTPSATPASAPAGPPSTGGTQVAQGPSQTATDAIPAPQQVLAQAQTVYQQDQAKKQAGTLTRAEAMRKAYQFMQLGIQFERAGVKIADNLKPVIDFYFGEAKLTERARDLVEAGYEPGTPEYKEAYRQKFEAEKTATRRDAEFAYGKGDGARAAVQEHISKDPSPTIMANRELAARNIRPGTPEYNKEFPATQEKYAKAAASSQSVTLGGGSDEQVFKRLEKSYDEAQSASRGLVSIREARNAVESGGIFGYGADKRLALQKLGKLVGVDDAGKIQNTESFFAAIAPLVGATLRQTSGTSQLSEGELKFANRAAAGDPTLDEKSILKVLTILEKINHGSMGEHQRRLNAIYPEAEDGKYKRERALFSVSEPATQSPPAPAAQSAPARKPAAPDGGGPPASYKGERNLWKFMTPEERALWN
jgi:hypothetical protein